jgi:hypothetical protein
MGKKSVEIHIAANGFSWISTFSIWWYIWLSLLLSLRYGFWRKGSWIPAITDEAVHPDFVRGTKVIHAGWDIWSGYDFLAGNKESDVFLKRFYERHCANWRPAQP